MALSKLHVAWLWRSLRESGRLLKAVNYNNNSGLAPQESFGGFTRE